MISYKPFWQTLKEKGISQYTLTEIYDVNKSLLQRLRDNQSITLNTIQDLCNILDCEIQDIVKVTPDKKEQDLEKEKGL